jgi:FkbM family methyltransferase
MFLKATSRTFGFIDHPARSLRALIRSQVLARGLLQRVHLADGVVLTAPLGHPNRCYAWTGELSWGVAAAIAICLKPGDVFLDIGAFTGQHTIRAAALVGERGRVIAVEPDRRCVHWMRANLSAAGLSSRVVLLEAAAVPAGQAGGTTTLHLSPMVSMSSVLAVPNAAGVTVPAVSMEELLTIHRPDLVKIDVEGFEAELLRGSPALRAAGAPTLIVEANPGAVEQACALGYQTIDLVEAACARDRRLLNLSEDVLAYKPGSLDAGDFVRRYREQLGRLRRLPRVEFLSRRSGPAS